VHAIAASHQRVLRRARPAGDIDVAGSFRARADGIARLRVAAGEPGRPQSNLVIDDPALRAKRPDQLADNIASTHVTLSADELRQLDGVIRLPADYPGWMLERQGQYRRQQIADGQIAGGASS
jgi:hypothetical protein